MNKEWLNWILDDFRISRAFNWCDVMPSDTRKQHPAPVLHVHFGLRIVMTYHTSHLDIVSGLHEILEMWQNVHLFISVHRLEQMDIRESTSPVQYLTQTGATGFYRSFTHLTEGLFVKSQQMWMFFSSIESFMRTVRYLSTECCWNPLSPILL